MSHDVDSDLVRKLANLLDETGLGELEYATDDWRIRVARPAETIIAGAPAMAAPAPAAVASADAAPAVTDLSKHPGAVTSPMVGTAYLAPDPDSPDFVSVGGSVTQGQTLMIVEAMKVMNPITAQKSGTVTRIEIQDEQPVEFGQVLMIIE